MTIPIPEMVKAIDIELAHRASSKGQASRQVRVQRGELRAAGQQAWVYVFKTAYEMLVSDGATVEVHINNERVAIGELLSSTGDETVLTVDTNLGARIPSAKLVIDDSFILTRLNDRLHEVGARASARWNWGLMDMLQDGKTRSRTPGDPDPDLGVTASRLNQRQHKARKIATMPMAYLWGPPGTGKTTTLATIAHDHLAAGRRVLLVSNTNIAVDTALEKVCCGFETDARDLEVGRVLRFGTVVKPELADQFGDDIDVDKIILKRVHVDLLADLQRLEQLIKSARRQVDGWLRLASATMSPRERSNARTQRDRWAARYSDLRREAKLRRELHNELRRQLVFEARLVGTTVYKAYLNEMIFEQQWDVVLIDEASMVLYPASMLMAAIAGSHVLIAGDFRQLPPIVESDDPLVQKWLGRDAFHVARIPDRVCSARPPGNLAILRDQHRMSRAICEVVSETFYPDSPLRTARSVPNRPPKRILSLPQSSLILIDTGDLKPWSSRSEWSSRYNPIHAQLITELADQLGRQGFLADFTSVAAIAPFRAQTALLEAAFATAFGSHHIAADYGPSGTVHKFQGNEKDLIVFDLTHAPPLRMPRWFTEEDLSMTGPRLMNVALSRARHRLIVIGHVACMRKFGGNLTRELLQRIEDAGRIIPGADLLADPHVTQWATESESLASIVAAEPRSLLLQASQLDAIIDAERHLVAARRGLAEVTVVTRPPQKARQTAWSAAMDRLRSKGVLVHVRQGLVGTMLITNEHATVTYANAARSLDHPVLVTASPQLAGALSKSLGRRPLAQLAGPLGDSACPACGRVMARLEARGGPYLRCTAEVCRRETRIVSRCDSPGCSGDLVLRFGPHNFFVGCTNFPLCKRNRDLTEQEDRDVKARSPFN